MKFHELFAGAGAFALVNGAMLARSPATRNGERVEMAKWKRATR